MLIITIQKMAFPIIPKREKKVTYAYPLSKYDPAIYEISLIQRLPDSPHMRDSVQKLFDNLNTETIILYSDEEYWYQRKISSIENAKKNIIEAVLEIYGYLMRRCNSVIDGKSDSLRIEMECDRKETTDIIVFEALEIELKHQGYAPKYSIEIEKRQGEDCDGRTVTTYDYDVYVHKLECVFCKPPQRIIVDNVLTLEKPQAKL